MWTFIWLVLCCSSFVSFCLDFQMHWSYPQRTPLLWRWHTQLVDWRTVFIPLSRLQSTEKWGLLSRGWVFIFWMTDCLWRVALAHVGLPWSPCLGTLHWTGQYITAQGQFQKAGLNHIWAYLHILEDKSMYSSCCYH